MLKLTYYENSFNLEFLDQNLENWVTTRVLLALRFGTNIYIEHSTASFVVSAIALNRVKAEITDKSIEICPCDAEFVEITLKGTWLTSDSTLQNGIFVLSLSKSMELLLQDLWQQQSFCQVVNG
jgi:hypothetical protein